MKCTEVAPEQGESSDAVFFIVLDAFYPFSCSEKTFYASETPVFWGQGGNVQAKAGLSNFVRKLC